MDARVVPAGAERTDTDSRIGAGVVMGIDLDELERLWTVARFFDGDSDPSVWESEETARPIRQARIAVTNMLLHNAPALIAAVRREREARELIEALAAALAGEGEDTWCCDMWTVVVDPTEHDSNCPYRRVRAWLTIASE